MSPDAFTILRPDGPPSSIVAHVPHASSVIPAEVRARLLLDDGAFARELVRMTDWHTDALFARTGRLGATRFVNGRSRLVVDPERFTDDAGEPMAAVGQGALAAFERKACAKGLDPADLGARLDAREKTLARTWEDRLRDQVIEVPAFEATWRQVRRALRQAGYHDAARPG